MPNVSELNPFNTHSFLSQSVGVPAQIQTLGHQSPKLKSSMADQNQAVQVNLIPLRSIRYYFFDSHLRFLLLSFLDRLYPSSFWFPLRINHHPISSDLWESLTPLSLLKPNPKESPLKQLCQDPMSGKTLSKPSPCPQLQVGETGIREDNNAKTGKWDSLRIAQCLELS
jgi:hypothetical protein